MDQTAQRMLTNRLLPAVLAAGHLEMGYFRSGLAVEMKLDRSPVTVADTEAEAVILAALARSIPGVPVVGEEAFAAGIRPVTGDTFALVDALDGTRQFVAGHPEFTINIALVSGGMPVYGLIYAPALDDLLVTDGPGCVVRARVAPASAVPSLDALDPVPVRVRQPSPEGLVALQSRSRNVDATNRYLTDFPVAARRLLGSSYKFCLIACGEADIYPQLGDTREWDTAAGDVILKAAGGCTVTTAGAPLVYGKRSSDYLNPPFIASCRPLALLRTGPER